MRSKAALHRSASPPETRSAGTVRNTLPGIAAIFSGRIRNARLTIGPKAKGVFPFFPRAAVTCYAGLGTTLTRIMTDNNSCHRSKAFAEARRTLDIRHVKTEPDNAKTTGMAGRFTETALREWHRPYAYLAFERRAAERPICVINANGICQTAA